MIQQISDRELKRMVLANHFAHRSPIEMARDFNGIQAQFGNYPQQAIRIRTDSASYENESWRNVIVRGWTLRGTMHVFDIDELGLFVHENRYDYEKYAYRGGARNRQEKFTKVVLDALSEQEYTRNELKDFCRVEGMQKSEEKTIFNPWGGIIWQLFIRRKLVLGFGANAKYRLAGECKVWGEDDARLEMLRRYFMHYGPASISDAMYYFRWKKSEIVNYMKKLELKEISCDGEIKYFIESKRSDYEMADKILSGTVLLAGFDPLLLGYEKKFGRFLSPERIREVYTLTGIIKPSIMYRGKIVGTWSRANGKFEYNIFEKLPQKEMKTLENEIEILKMNVA